MCQSVKVPFVLLPPQIPDDPDPYPLPKGEMLQAVSTASATITSTSCSEVTPRRGGEDDEQPLCSIEEPTFSHACQKN